MLWQIDLDNYETITEDHNDLGHWGKILKKCHDGNLSILNFRLVSPNGSANIIDKNADRYFVINEITAFVGGSSISRRGIGSVREKTNKVRIEWYCLNTRNYIFTEVNEGVKDYISEISIQHI